MKPRPHQITDGVVANRALTGVLQKITEIAGVPLDNRLDLIKSLQLEIAIAHNFADRVALFSGSDIRRSAKRIAHAAAGLADAMANQGAVEFIPVADQ